MRNQGLVMPLDLSPARQGPSPAVIKRRCFFYILGYEPLLPARVHQRFERDLAAFKRTWNAAAQLTAPTTTPEGDATWSVESSGPNWQVHSDIILLDWSDCVADFAQLTWRQMALGFVALFNFLLGGSGLGYLRANWRYLLFCLYPILLIGLFGTVGFLVAGFVVPKGVPWRFVLVLLLGLSCVALLVRWLGRTLHFNYALLDWVFALDVVRQRRPEFEAKLDRLANIFVTRLRAARADEVVVFGHSLGAVVMIQVVARALQKDAQLARDAGRINLISAGSSLLKIGLHPAAQHFRLAVSRVVAESNIFWVEYQALVDLFSFYKTNPVLKMGLPACGKPEVRIVRIRKMVSDSTYRRIRWNYLRLHRQFTSGNERRYFYDFFMICCGPVPLRFRMACRPEEVVASIASDGSYLRLASINTEHPGAPALIMEKH
jgi:pimeloyl-ACP methyl ester carboxylesterase